MSGVCQCRLSRKKSFCDEEDILLCVGKATLELALTGSVLMELAFADRFDADPEHVIVSGYEPTGNPMEDKIPERIAASDKASKAKEWIEALAQVETAAIHARGQYADERPLLR